jgi:hypothetical protein
VVTKDETTIVDGAGDADQIVGRVTTMKIQKRVRSDIDRTLSMNR